MSADSSRPSGRAAPRRSARRQATARQPRRVAALEPEAEEHEQESHAGQHDRRHPAALGGHRPPEEGDGRTRPLLAEVDSRRIDAGAIRAPPSWSDRAHSQSDVDEPDQRHERPARVAGMPEIGRLPPMRSPAVTWSQKPYGLRAPRSSATPSARLEKPDEERDGRRPPPRSRERR